MAKIIALLVIGGFAAMVMTNQWLQKSVQEITRHPAPTAVAMAPPAPVTAKEAPQPNALYRKHGQKVLRKDRLSPGRDYMESVFYLDGEEIARQKIVNGTVLDSDGQIAQGKVDFIDESKATRGVEYYKDGQKNGPSLTYFSSGQLNVDAYYQNGALLRKKEYYNNGALRIEINYEGARTNMAGKEAGDGKVYYRDGVVKYEWHFTQSDKVGYQRSYNPDGTLRAAFYFDENGQLTP
ncbi:MAG: hypothetical protein HZA28_03725 [Candidatus Omnitrophica bacterium]|nr:hypothetical protein [Candidatus Omnitrophota bacterium]